MARDQLSSDLLESTNFGGLEPNRLAVGYGREVYPWLQFIGGSVQEMLSGKLQIPADINICVISRVFMILHPDTVDRMLKFLQDRVEQFIICDDIMNVDGEVPLIRGPSRLLIMHPFRRIFKKIGFEINELYMAKVPDRECSGFLIASPNE